VTPEFLIKLGAPAALILLSQLLGIFVLPHPGSWLPAIGNVLRYVSALAGAGTAHGAGGPKSKLFAILVPFVGVIAFSFAYQYLIQHPPTLAEADMWGLGMAVTFIFAYFATGFLVSGVVAAIWPVAKV